MNVERLVVGDLETNCYIVNIDDEYIIIDPGDDFPTIKEHLKGKKVVGCLVTHFHFDHIGALEEVISYYDLDVNKVNSKKFKYEVIKTPGHTVDSKTFYFKKAKIMFCGDFIFEKGIGRTDLGGNMEDMKDSLKMISEYPDDITLYPGHGSYTTLGKEKKYFSYYN